jgi:hypothetical protein
MKPHELFGVAVRSLGVWVFAETLMNLSFGASIGVVMIVMKITLAFYLFFRATFIVGLAYPKSHWNEIDPLKISSGSN